MKIFYLPDLGEGLSEAEIREWYVKEGDTVKVDQSLLSVETAKAIVDVPSPYEGRIEKLHGKAHDIIKTHAPLVEFFSHDKGAIVGNLEESTQPFQEGAVVIGAPVSSIATVKALPAVRALAKQINVDLNTVTPTGPKGQITAEDVKQHGLTGSVLLKQGETLHGTRRTMAVTMTQAHEQVAQMTLMDDVDLGQVASDTDITVLILKAMVAGIQAEPSMNAWFDGKTCQRQLLTEINIGVAMDTSEGLFVPVLKKVNECSVMQLREKINSLKETVRSRTIVPSDMQNATIIFSNFGTISGKYASPMVIPPMVSILGCGRIHEAAVVRSGKVIASRVLPLSVSADHRAVTGGEVARFLAAVKKFLESAA